MSDTSRRELMFNGITFRELTLPSQETDGFVVRVVMGRSNPRKIVTVVRQPGQENLDVQTVTFQQHPYPLGYTSCRDAEPEERESLESAVSFLKAIDDAPHDVRKPLASVALQHIAPELEV